MGWDACTQEPFTVVRWFECHPGTAAWLQALLIAVPVVLWVVDRQTRNKERYNRTCSFVASLTPAVYLLEGKLNLIEQRLSAQQGPPDPAALNTWFASCRLNVPEQLRDASPMHTLQANLVAPFLGLVLTTSAYNGYLDEFAARAYPTLAAAWPQVILHLLNQVHFTQGILKKAQAVIETAKVSR